MSTLLADGDVSDTIGAQHPRAAVLKQFDRRRHRVPESVALPHADERQLRPDRSQQLNGHCVRTPVVTDFNDIDITDDPCVSQWVQNFGLRVARQNSGQPRALHQKHHR